MEEKWAELTPDEKREKRLKRWISPTDIEFISPAAEKIHKEKATRLSDALMLKEPDRVPVMLPTGNFPAYYAGGTLHKVMYDYDELCRAWLKFLYEFDMDTWSGPAFVHSGRVLEILDYKLYKWPGRGLANSVSQYQYVEGEYMKADEYDALINDPSDFTLRVLLPRILGALEPLKALVPLSSIWQLPLKLVAPIARPDVQDALQALLDAGREMAKWQKAVGDCNREARAAGMPSFFGGSAGAPFDHIGDGLRGTHGIMLDMYRQPDKLIEAMEKITPLIIENAIASVNASGGIMAGSALHKGDDTFMSREQFKTFYWPTLKKVIMALIEEGIMVMLFAEGRYETRLDIIRDIPRGWAMWWFDQTDMSKAKEILGDTTCIAGNVPSSMLYTSTPQAVKEYCRRLIEVCGKGGGYILAGGSSVETAKAENIHAIMEAARQYGVYK
jgi:hypothetical protein